MRYCEELIQKNNGDYYCINCLHSFKTKNKLKLHENLSKNLVIIKIPEKYNNT